MNPRIRPDAVIAKSFDGIAYLQRWPESSTRRVHLEDNERCVIVREPLEPAFDAVECDLVDLAGDLNDGGSIELRQRRLRRSRLRLRCEQQNTMDNGEA